MDVRFDVENAEKLIEAMCTYCSSIQKDAKDTLRLIDSLKGWDDKQFEYFVDSIKIICLDLDKALKLESNYLNTFQERVNELRR